MRGIWESFLPDGSRDYRHPKDKTWKDPEGCRSSGWVYRSHGNPQEWTARISLPLCEWAYQLRAYNLPERCWRRRFSSQDKAERWVEKKVAKYLRMKGII